MRTELLAPAGSSESAAAALAAGADAVYIGGTRFGARAYADNPDGEGLKRTLELAHLSGKKLYLTVNTLLKDAELEELYGYLEPLYREGLDAVIVQDLGVLRYVRDVFPGLPIHASTQMGITGAWGAKLLKEAGATRVVTARELSLEEIRKIKNTVDIEIESFVHGALCFCYSGQCLFSSMIGGRSGNRGRCAQPCRLPYDLFEEDRRLNGKEERFLLSPRDICTLELLPQIIAGGVDSLKIEGRMKSPEYTAGVTAIYRKYLDRCLEAAKQGDPDGRPKGIGKVEKQDREALLTLFNRMGFSQGYYRQQNGPDMMASRRPEHPDMRLERQEQARREALTKVIHEKYVNRETPEKINGKLILSIGKPAILSLNAGNTRAEAAGETPVPAEKRPLTPADAEKQLRKTGGSGFVFERLEIVMEEGLFLPIQALNELRRKGLEALRTAILDGYRRPEGRYRAPEATDCEKAALPGALPWTEPEGFYIAASLEEQSCFEALLTVPGLDALYLDCTAFSRRDFPERAAEAVQACHRSGKACAYVLPWIFRETAAAYYRQEPVKRALLEFDALILRNQEEVCFLRECGIERPLLADWNLYTFNREARRFWQEEGIAADTAPVELNLRELRERGLRGSELIACGYQPLMVSAQCQVKNRTGCTKKPQLLFLRDRKGKRFAVKNQCLFCTNVIYNSAPLSLLDCAEEIRQLHPSGIRLSFTREDGEEAALTAKEFVRVFKCGGRPQGQPAEFTRGHFRRGVE